MASPLATILKKTASLAGATFASRILGFIREILMASVLGGGATASAWGFAFRLPNMTRKIFGEGLLGTILISMLSQTIEKRGNDNARMRFSTIFIWLTAALASVSILVSAVAIIAGHFVEKEHLVLACKLIPIVMPYCIFICLIGAMTSVLNSAKTFFVPALLSLSLNICMIAALLFVCPHYSNEPEKMLDALGYSVLLSGAIELVLMLFVMKRYQLFPVISMRVIKRFRVLKEVWILAVPGLLGALAYEGNILADTLIAGWINQYAIAALGYSERLVYLPIGVFAVAFGTVSLSELSRLTARKDYTAMIETQFGTLRYLLFVTIPLSFFMYFFACDILELVYMHGKFGTPDLQQTLLAFSYYILGIPAFAALKVTLAGFYARKEMKTPMMVSVSCMALNFILNIILMFPLKQGGLALSTSICSYLNNIVLLIILQKQIGKLPAGSLIRYILLLTGISAAAIAGACYCARTLFVPFGSIKIRALGTLAVGGIVFAVIFMILAILFRMDELKGITNRIFRKRKGA